MTNRLILLVATALLASAVDAAAATPSTLAFSARLMDDDGLPFAGMHRVTVSIFEADKGGDALWSESHEADVLDDGLVHFALGDTSPLTAVTLARAQLFVEIGVDKTTMKPRLALASLPFATRSAVTEQAERFPAGVVLQLADLAAQRVLVGLGGSRHEPAVSCNDLHRRRADAPSGLYWLQPASARTPFEAYCDMVTDGGGWTLVWSNLRGGRNKVVTDMMWADAIETLPRFTTEPSGDLESFAVYTGLRHWVPLAPDFTLRYSWSSDYGRGVEQSYRCTFNLTGATFVISFSTSTCKQLAGAAAPGMVTYSNNRPFATFDRTDINACPATYANTPWWYDSCWSGSINGGGESSGPGGGPFPRLSPLSYGNGAYWFASTPAWGTPDGHGAGNGWIFVR